MEDHRLAPKRQCQWHSTNLLKSSQSLELFLGKTPNMMSTNVMSSQWQFSSLNIDSSVLFKNHEVITKRVNASSNTKITKSSVPTKQQFERIHFDSPRRLSQVICVINYNSFHPWWNSCREKVMDAWSGSMCHLSAGTEILNGGRRNVLLAIQYWLFRADQPALTQFTWISCYIGRALRSFNNERLVDRVGSDVGREKTRESFIRSVNGEWGCCEFHPLNVRETHLEGWMRRRCGKISIIKLWWRRRKNRRSSKKARNMR